MESIDVLYWNISISVKNLNYFVDLILGLFFSLKKRIILIFFHELPVTVASKNISRKHSGKKNEKRNPLNCETQLGSTE